jgi:hypothetical protein
MKDVRLMRAPIREHSPRPPTLVSFLLMHLLDGIALSMLIAAGIAFGVGASSLARAEDLKALYWLVVGIVAVRGAVQIARPRGA